MRRTKALLFAIITLVSIGWAAPVAQAAVDVYLTPGTHTVNGRQWKTSCESYSQTKRCRTEIWASVVAQSGSGYKVSNGWQFNNLTYAPSDFSLWAENPLAVPGATWTEGTRKWRTECFTALTGRGCRSWIEATVIETYKNDAGNSAYRQANLWVLNNMVRFSAEPIKPLPLTATLACANTDGGRTLSIDVADPDSLGYKVAFVLANEKPAAFTSYKGTQKATYFDKGHTCQDEWSGAMLG